VPASPRVDIVQRARTYNAGLSKQALAARLIESLATTEPPKVAGWTGVERLESAFDEALVLQFGGGSATLASLGDKRAAVRRRTWIAHAPKHRGMHIATAQPIWSVALADALGIRKFAFCGLSLGGPFDSGLV
jgi:hypothetical protein